MKQELILNLLGSDIRNALNASQVLIRCLFVLRSFFSLQGEVEQIALMKPKAQNENDTGWVTQRFAF